MTAVNKDHSAKACETGIEAPSDNPSASLSALQHKIDDALNNAAHSSPSFTAFTATATPPPLLELYHTRRQITTHIPSFWLTVLLSHPAFTLIVTACDAHVLRHLVDVDIQPVETATHHTDFQLVLAFDTANPYFSHTRLVKTYLHSDNNGRVVGIAAVTWNATQQQQPQHENSHFQSPHDDDVLDPSHLSSGFFHWLLQDSNDSANLGELIRDTIFPNAIDLYFGTFTVASDDAEHTSLTSIIR